MDIIFTFIFGVTSAFNTTPSPPLADARIEDVDMDVVDTDGSGGGSTSCVVA